MQSALAFRPRAVSAKGVFQRAAQAVESKEAAEDKSVCSHTQPSQPQATICTVAAPSPERDSGIVDVGIKRPLPVDASDQEQLRKKRSAKEQALRRELELKEALLRKFLDDQRRLREYSGVTEEPAQDFVEDIDTRAVDAEFREEEAEESEPQPMITESKTDAPLHVTSQEDTNGILADAPSDSEGYYKLQENELVLQRYRVVALLGKGVFSAVFRATDTLTSTDVALKVMRCNEMMTAAGAKEAALLAQLASDDSNARTHIVSLLHNFTHRGHFCMVLELCHCSLRKLIKKYGNGQGLSLAAVRSYGRQLFKALRHIHNCGIVHADIKPDNMVVNQKLNVIKICDFGSAYRNHELNSITSMQYIVARYYRAPEIVLGYAPKGPAMDVWSMGVTLLEMYTSKLPFTGRHNNGLLKSIMDMLGPIPKRLIRKSPHQSTYFGKGGKFILKEENRGNDTESTRLVTPTQQSDLATFIAVERIDSADVNRTELGEFEDLIANCLHYDPVSRLSAENALKHPFFRRTNTTSRK